MLNFPKDNWLHLTFKLHQTSEFLLLESWSNMFSFKTINQKNLLFFNVQISVGWGGIASTSPHQRSGWICGLEYYQRYLNLTCLVNLLKAAKNSHVTVLCRMGVFQKVYNFLWEILASFYLLGSETWPYNSSLYSSNCFHSVLSKFWDLQIDHRNIVFSKRWFLWPGLWSNVTRTCDVIFLAASRRFTTLKNERLKYRQQCTGM